MDKTDNKKVRTYVFNKTKGHCSYCGCKITIDKFTIDHIEPRRRYPTNLKIGENKIDNYLPCCGSCNSSKSTLSVDEFRNSITKKIDSIRNNSSQFRILERFGKIKIEPGDIVFYFETI
ncbi:MAG: HNH endonuclease signature motif containing protein [Bacteroidota bacterium]